MAQHVIECPNCLHRLLVAVEEAVGATVQQNVQVLDHAPPLAEVVAPEPEPAPEEAPAEPATAPEIPAEAPTEVPAPDEPAEPAPEFSTTQEVTTVDA